MAKGMHVRGDGVGFTLLRKKADPAREWVDGCPSVTEGETVTVLKVDNAFSLLRLASGAEGWVWSKYIRSAQSIHVRGDGVRFTLLRKKADPAHEWVDGRPSVAEGETVTLLRVEGAFSLLRLASGAEGWVWSKYIRALHEPGISAGLGHMLQQALDLGKPQFAQTPRSTSALDAGSEAPASKACPYMQQCAAFLDSLSLNPNYLDPKHNRCYCPTCMETLPIPDVLETSSAHGYAYEVPKGWCGFGLSVPSRAKALNVFEAWAVSFHGCPASVVPSVLQEGRLMMPGDRLMDGTRLPNRCTAGGDDGDGEGRIGLYTSPSIKYSELEIYTEPQEWNGSKVSLVLQCRQDMTVKHPALRIEGETIGWENRFGDVQISAHFPNSEIERYTDASNSIIPYRILVAMDVVTREAEEEEKRAHRLNGSNLDPVGAADAGPGGLPARVLDQARAACEAAGDLAGVGRECERLASCYNNMGQPARALPLHEQARAAYEAVGDRAGVGRACEGLGICYNNMVQPARALLPNEQARAAYEAVGDRAGVGRACEGLGVCHNNMGQPARALPWYVQARGEYEAVGDGAGVARVCGYFADCAARAAQAPRPSMPHASTPNTRCVPPPLRSRLINPTPLPSSSPASSSLPNEALL